MIRYIVLIIFFLPLFSCNSDNERSDKSFSLSKYYELGIKDISIKWNYTDYLNASEVIKEIQLESKEFVPRKYSNKSKQLFSKLLSDEALEVMGVQSNDSFAGNKANYYDNLIEVYIDPGNEFQWYNKEVVDLLTFGLKAFSNQYFSIVHAIDTATIELSAEQNYMFNQLESAYILSLLDYVDGLESNQISESEIILNAKYLTEIFPAILIKLRSEHKQQIMERVKYHAKNHRLEEVRKLLNEFIISNSG
jgi:hypothetical protein